MRFERRGTVSPLTPEWRKFLLEVMGGQDLDEVQSSEERRADFSCLSGLLVVEMKSLEEDGSERMDNLTDELRQRPDWPQFYGSAPVQAMLKNVAEPEKVRLQFLNRIGRAIINHLKKANKQLAAHEQNHPRKNTVRVMLVINEDHEIYEPQVVAYVLQHALRRTDNGKPLYPYIDAVIFTSERHATRVGSDIAFPLLSVEGPGLDTAVWKRTVLDELMRRWANWNGIPLHKNDAAIEDFKTIEDIPDQMPRHELWRLEYRRDPYFADLKDEELCDRFDEVMVVQILCKVEGGPIKLPPEAMMCALPRFTHILEEANKRGITMDRMAYDPVRFAVAASRLNFPLEVIDWFSSDLDRRKA